LGGWEWPDAHTIPGEVDQTQVTSAWPAKIRRSPIRLRLDGSAKARERGFEKRPNRKMLAQAYAAEDRYER